MYTTKLYIFYIFGNNLVFSHTLVTPFGSLYNTNLIRPKAKYFMWRMCVYVHMYIVII